MLVKDDSCIAEQTILRYQSTNIAELLGCDWYGILLRNPEGEMNIDTYFDVNGVVSETILEFARKKVSKTFLSKGISKTFACKSGHYFVYPIRRTDKGYFVFFIFMRKDSPFEEKDIKWYITYGRTGYQRILLENELVQVKNYNMAVLDCADFAVAVVDKKYNVISRNQMGEEYFEESSYIGKYFANSTLVDGVGGVFSTGEKLSLSQVVYYNEKKNEHAIFNMTLSPLHNSKNLVAAVVIVASNVTKINIEAQTSAQKRYYRGIEDVSMGLIKDLRNPLMNIRGCAELLSQYQPFGPDEQKLIGYINEEIDRIDHIIEQLSAFSAVNKKDGYSKVDLNVILNNCIKAADRQKALKQVEFVLTSQELLLYEADSREMYIVFLGLLQNLLRAINRHGQIFIFAESDSENRRVKVTLKCVGENLFKEKSGNLEMISNNILKKYGAALSRTEKMSNSISYLVDLPLK